MLQSGAHHWRCLFTQSMNIPEIICMGNQHSQHIINTAKIPNDNIILIDIIITTYYVFFYFIFNTLHEDYFLFLRGAANPLKKNESIAERSRDGGKWYPRLSPVYANFHAQIGCQWRCYSQSHRQNCSRLWLIQLLWERKKSVKPSMGERSLNAILLAADNLAVW